MKRAVIAEDEALSRELLIRLIEKYHLPIRVVGEAETGEKAVTLIRELRPEVVFLDIKMPGMSGLEVMEVFQNAPVSMKFIVITAYDQFEYAQSALRLGAKDILLKPIYYRQLIESMQRVVGYRYTDHPAFNELIDYAEEHYAENITLEKYAERVHMSQSYIARLFRKYFDASFKRWLNELRICKAMELLETTDLSIKDIADRVGYNNLNYFYRQFNQIVGTTPKNYRN